MSVAPGDRLGSYEITAKLGEGGMGEVYRATDTKLKREVAIKVLPAAFTEDKERLARFEREAQLLAQLQHPNIASIYGLEESEGTRALVMELVEGPTLADRLESGSLSLDESLAIARQVAEALEEAHEKGIIHRDLKPQNIKAPIEGKVKVLDFGLAKAMDPASGVPGSVASLAASPTLTVGATAQGMILGTAAYMSPEQAKGRPVDKRADIWAFGVVVWEMLTGRRLFEADSVPETLAAIFSRDLSLGDLPASVPEPLRRLVGRCLERDARRRLRDIGEARLVLDAPMAGDDSRTLRTAPPAAIASRGGPAGWFVAALLAVVAGVLALRTPASAPRPELLRFSISSASGASIAPGAGNSAISPDGRRVVFVGGDAEGRQGLWIQELDQVRARLVAGTAGASYPFWAPDSRRVGFFAESKLRKVSIDGGQIETLAEAIEGRGGSWGGGTIVFAPAVIGGLSVISESGGAPRQVTEIEKPEEEQSHRYPCFLPDGRRFLYLSDPGAGIEQGGVYLASVDGGERRLLYRSRRAPVFAEPGFLIDAIDDRLVARAFDAKAGALRGEPQRLEERTPSYVNTADRAASVSTSGKLLVAAMETGRMKVVTLDRRGRQVGEVPLPKGAYTSPALSPDGGRLAIARGDSADRKVVDLWILDLVAERPSRLTFASGAEDYPVWSPDGARLVFQSDRSGVNDLWIRTANGAGDERVLYASPTAWKQAYSWIGDTLAFVTTENETGFDIWLLHPDRTEEPPTRLLGSPASEFDPAISPDGRWLAYASNESGRQQIYVVSLPDAKTKYQVTTEGGRHPLWTRNGGELLYLAGENSVAAVAVARGDSLAFGTPEALFSLPRMSLGSGADEVLFAVTTDGDRIFLVEPEGEGSATLTVVTDWLAELDGSEDRQ